MEGSDRRPLPRTGSDHPTPGKCASVQAAALMRMRSGVIVLATLVPLVALAADPGGGFGLYAWVGTPERHLGVLAWALAALALMAGQTLDPERDRPAVTWTLTVAGPRRPAGGGASRTIRA